MEVETSITVAPNVLSNNQHEPEPTDQTTNPFPNESCTEEECPVTREPLRVSNARKVRKTSTLKHPAPKDQDELLEQLAARIIWCEKWRKLDNKHLKSYILRMPKHLIVTLERNLNMEFNTDNLLEIFRIVENQGNYLKYSNVRTVINGIKAHKFKSLPGARAIDADAYDPRSKEDMTFDYGTVDFPNETVGKGVSDCSLSSEVSDSNAENRATDRSRSTSQRTNETMYDTTISKSPEINEASTNTIKTPSAFYKPTNVSTTNRIFPATASNFRPYVPFAGASEHGNQNLQMATKAHSDISNDIRSQQEELAKLNEIVRAQQAEQEAVEARKQRLLEEVRAENDKLLMTRNSFDRQIEKARYSINLKAKQLAEEKLTLERLERQAETDRQAKLERQVEVDRQAKLERKAEGDRQAKLERQAEGDRQAKLERQAEFDRRTKPKADHRTTCVNVVRNSTSATSDYINISATHDSDSATRDMVRAQDEEMIPGGDQQAHEERLHGTKPSTVHASSVTDQSLSNRYLEEINRLVAYQTQLKDQMDKLQNQMATVYLDRSAVNIAEEFPRGETQEVTFSETEQGSERIGACSSKRKSALKKREREPQDRYGGYSTTDFEFEEGDGESEESEDEVVRSGSKQRLLCINQPSIRQLYYKTDDVYEWFVDFEKQAAASSWDRPTMARQAPTHFYGVAENVYNLLPKADRKNYTAVNRHMLKKNESARPDQ